MTSVEIVGTALDALNGLSVPYMLVGSFSSNLYGVPRSTKDADFVVQLNEKLLNALVARLGGDFQLQPQMTFETITGTMRYRLQHRASAFTIELFELSQDPHDRERFARRIRSALAGREAFVPTAEDVVVTKLRWSKHGKRAKDVEDVANVIAIQRDILDLPYIRRWCDQHGTRELLEELL